MRAPRDGSNDISKSCGLSQYRASLDCSFSDGPGNKLTPATAANPLHAEVTGVSPEGLPDILVEGGTSGDPGANGERSEANSTYGDGNNLRVPSVVNDDCSEGSQCSWGETRLSRPYSPPLRRRRSDSSNSEQGGDDGNNEDAGGGLGLLFEKLFKGDRFKEMLRECVVNTDLIRPNYEDIFIDPRTIQKLEQVTTLSLTREKAFSHGILRGNRVTGAILYGPPGTGKSLLAKGMAKQSGFKMIAVSTSELFQKCHGDDEKVIKALFSLARKLYPSIVFIDEADALLGARKAGEKRHIRAMLNKFLMEWDGLTSGVNSPFVLLATNRPFDLDPAVLRRAPVHIHLDVPTTSERIGILRLLLKEERLARDITIEKLALLTPKYTGSDLKNLCVTAASSCVAEQPVDTAERVLQRHHFMSALSTVKATGLSTTMVNEFQNFEKNARYEEARPEG